MRSAERGFSLVELMVVVLVIAILIAIAIPTFLGAREQAQDRGGQSSLRNALTAAITIRADDGDYANADYLALEDEEPRFEYLPPGTKSEGQNEISVDPGGITIWVGALESDSGDCFYLLDDLSSGTWYSSTLGGNCTALAKPGYPGASWRQNSW